MASTFINDLVLNEMATGDQSGSWGTVTNLNLEMIAEAFSYGAEAIANSSTHTITIPQGAKGDERSLYLKCTGGGQACTVSLAPNTVSKVWLIENATAAVLTFSQGTGANVAIPAGQVKMIATSGGGNSGIVYDLLTDVNLAGTTVMADVAIGGKVITMTGSAGDTATLTVAANGALAIATTDAAAAAANISITADGTFTAAATTITLDSAGAIVLDADGGVIQFKDGGTTIGSITNSSSDLVIKSNVQDKDILLQGDDGGTGITALTLDMSAGGNALFSGTVTRDLTRGSLDVGNSSGVSAPLAAGTSGYFLKSDGTDAAWAEVVGSDSRQNYVADGNITARQAVFLKNDGKVSAAQSFKIASRSDVGSTGFTSGGNTSQDGYSKSTNAYSTVDNVHVTIYLKGGWASGVNNAVCVVSQINADGSITSGSDNNTLFGSSTYRSPCTVEMQYSSTINKFIILYTYKTSSSNHYLRMAIGTLSGNAGAANKTFTLSNQVSIGGENSTQRIQGYYSGGNYGGGLPGAGGSFYFTPDGSNIKGLLHGAYCNASQSGYVGTHVVGFTVAANGTLAVGGFVPLTGGGASAGTGWAGYQFEGTFHYHIPTNQWVSLLNAGGAGCYMHMFTQGSGSTTITQISNDDKINFATAGIVVAEGLSNATMQTVDNTHIYAVLQYGPNKWVYRFTIGSTTLTGGTGNDFTQLKEVDPKTGIAVGGGTSTADWRIFSGFKAYRESGLGFYQGWTQQPGVNYNVTNSSLKKVYYSEFVYTGDNANLGYLRQAEYQQSVNSTEIDSQMINGHGSYDDERDAFFLFGWAGNPASTAFTLNPLVKGAFSAGDIGSGTVPIGIHDSGSTVSNGATASIGMFGSVVEGFSGLPVGGVIKTSSATGRRAVGYAISATKVMVTENNK